MSTKSLDEGLSKDMLPFPLSVCPTAAEISLSLEAGRTQLGQAEGTESRLDEHLQEAGLEAWAFLVTWALNFVYSGRHGERAERLETSQSSKHDMNTAQTQALAQLRKHISRISGGSHSASTQIGQASWRPRRLIIMERKLERLRWLPGDNWSQRCRRLVKRDV